jgi:hypothetical protein
VMAFRFRPDPGLAPPRPIPLDFVISNPLNFWRPSGALSSKGREQPSHCREIGLAQAGIDAPRPGGPVPWSCRRAPRFDLFAARHDHKQFRAWPGWPRESVSGILDAAMKSRRRAFIMRVWLSGQRGRSIGVKNSLCQLARGGKKFSNGTHYFRSYSCSIILLISNGSTSFDCTNSRILICSAT